MDSENMSKCSENTVQKSDDYKEIFFNDHTVMFLIDPVTLKIMDANLAAINFYGYRLEEFVKLKISDINVASNEFVLDKIQKSVSKEKNHFIFKHRLSNGEIRDVEVYSGLIKQNGKDVLYSIIHDITDDELQNTLKRFYTILSSMYGAILLVSDTNLIEFTNQAFCDYFRLDESPEELIGLDGNEIIEKIKNEYLNPEEAVSKIKEIVSQNEPIKGQEVELKDGRTCIRDYIPINISRKSYGRLWHHYDITERKKTEEEIVSNRKLLNAINKVFQEYLTTETIGEVVEKCLEVAEELTESEFGFFGEINENGLLDDRALSPPAWDVCETPNAHELLKNMEIVSYWGRTIKEEKSQIVNDPNVDPDRRGLPKGHPPITSFLGVPLKEGGKTIGMIALANKKTGYNETDKKNIEALAVAFVEVFMRKKAEIQIKENLKNMKQSNKELEQFAYITSHDLREPLRMITSFLQLLERRYKDKIDQDANEFIGFAVDGAKRLDAMTNDLLEYSRITRQVREIKQVNFEDVLEEALSNLKVPIEENNAVITHDPLPTIMADVKLKVQLFQNLIANAIKYRSNETPKIHISATRENNQYLFKIKDNGIGMSPDHLERIFTIFQRLHTQEEYEGTGIGLAISQKIVHQQGGEIWAESESGKGSTFYFTIPINPDL